MRMLKTIGLIGAASLIAAGCGSSAAKPASQTINLSRAAYVSTAASGFKAVISLQESIPSLGQVTMSGTGAFSLPAHTGAVTMQMSIPSAAATRAGLSNFRIQAVMVPGTIYMKLPAQLADKIPGGKPWWKINLSQAAKLAGIPGLSSLLSGTSTINDPSQYLDFLRATAAGSVQDLGPATVDGVQTTHYHAVIDISKLPDAVPAGARPGVEQLVATLQKKGAVAKAFPIDAWIDASHRIRRIQMAYDQTISGQSAAVSMNVDFVDYGAQPPPKVPPPGQTLDLLALLRQG